MGGVAVLVSGRGSNLQALLDAGCPVACVVSDRADAGALDHARAAGIPAVFVDPTLHPDRRAYGEALDMVLATQGARAVVLAGFMRILDSGFVQRWSGRMLNIHPSLLPKYRGLHTHRRALAAGDTEHGASVHFVNEKLDGGPVILQVILPILPGEDEAVLAARVQVQEHRIYPWAVHRLVEGRLRLDQGRVHLDGRTLDVPLRVGPEDDLSCLAA